MIAKYVFGDSEEDHDREAFAFARFFPHDPKDFGAEILGCCSVVCSASEIAVDAVVAGRMDG